MNRSSRVRLALYTISIGMFILGVAMIGFASYSEIQSTPYLVQVEETTTSAGEPTVSYSDLTSSEKTVFDRVKDGGAAPVEDTTLTTFANNAVRYQGEIYTFDITYDPATLTLLPFGLGIIVATVGGALLFLTNFITGRRMQTSNAPV